MARKIALLLLLCAVPLAAAAVAPVRPRIISVDQIRPGMRGYGLTVFRGIQPERFEVEVIDVLENFAPDQDLILIRTKHPVFEKVSAVAGMSGSPIYLNGRLAGAYAYGWYFGKEPVAGVTPIANMLAEIDRPLDPEIWRALGTLPRLSRKARSKKPSRAHLAGLPPYLGDEQRRGAFGALDDHAARLGIDTVNGGSHRPGFRPVATPLLMGGMDEVVVRELAERFECFGLIPLQAGGGRAKNKARKPSSTRFVNGGAIAVQLIRGDISAQAVGTVTHVAGKRLVAFGHPMLNAGQIALPTATARVLHVLASQRRSFKISETIEPLGTLVHDRQAAIVVETGIEPQTIPLRVRLRGVKGARRTKWKMELASHRLLTPILTFAAVANAVRATASDRSHAVFTVTGRVELEDQGRIEVRDVGYTPVGVGVGQALSRLRLFDLLEAAYGNPFEHTRVHSIAVDIDLRFVREVTTIVNAMVESKEVDPGRPVDLTVTLRPFGGQERVEVIQVPIPESAAGANIEIILQPGDEVEVEQPRPESLADLIEAVKSGYPSTSLVVSTRLPSSGLRMYGHVVRSLPSSAFDALQPRNESDSGRPFATHERMEIALDNVVVGSTRLKLKVRETPREKRP